MPIPHAGEIVPAILEELKKAGGVAQRQDIIEKIAWRFRVSPVERNYRDPSGSKTFDKRIDSAATRLRRQGLMEPVEKSGRNIWKLTKPPTITAQEATEIALAFIKKHYHFIPQQPIKAVPEGSVWLVEIDVGLLRSRIAKLKIDANTEAILEYTIPPEAV